MAIVGKLRQLVVVVLRRASLHETSLGPRSRQESVVLSCGNCDPGMVGHDHRSGLDRPVPWPGDVKEWPGQANDQWDDSEPRLSRRRSTIATGKSS